MKAADQNNDAEIEGEIVEEERKTQKPNEDKIQFEYTIANEMEELGASNVYAEFMQIF